MIGKKVLNYEIKSLIGEGGMGNVYLAEHMQLGRKVAIKCLHAQLVNNPNIRARFKNEAATMAALQHSGIVALYDYLEEPDGLYLVMEYVDGISLDDYIKNLSGPIPAEKTIAFMSQILEAVGFAHSHGIVHRDLKPSNILLTKTGTIKILDFGIAKLLSEVNNKMTKTGTQMGTVFYMSPEQVHGTEVDRRTDIYALGVTLFQMLTGSSPYDGVTTEYAVYNKIVNEQLPGVMSIYPGAPVWMDNIILKATAKNPNDRFQDCNEFRAALAMPAQVVPPVQQPAANVPPPVVNIPANPVVGNNSSAGGKKKGKTVLYVAIAAVVVIVGIVTVYIMTRPVPEEVAADLTREYIGYFDAGLKDDMTSMQLEDLLKQSQDKIDPKLADARNLFDGNDEKTNRLNGIFAATADSIANVIADRIDEAIYNQLQGGMWAKQNEDEYKDFLYYFSNDTMRMGNRKGEFVYKVNSGYMSFPADAMKGKIHFEDENTFVLTADDSDVPVTYARASSRDSLIGNWTASDYDYSYNYWTGLYDYNPTSYSVTFTPDSMVTDRYDPYRFSFDNGKMVWYYKSSGEQYKDWGHWYLKTKNTLMVNGAAVSALYRNRAKAADSPSVMFAE